MRVLGLIVLAGCGRIAFDELRTGDAAAGDGAADTTCWLAWRAQTVRLGAPRQLTELGAAQHGDAFPSFDGRTLYYVEEVGNAEIHYATRPEGGIAWTPQGAIAELSNPASDVKLTLSADELVGVFSSNRAGADFQLWHVTRPTKTAPFSVPSQALLGNTNTAFDDFDAHLTPDGLHLYYAPDSGGGQLIQLYTRAIVTDAFAFDRSLFEIQQTGTYSDPSVSPDELVIVYAGLASGELFYALRTTTSVNFEPPQLVPDVDGGGRQTDVEVSSDGCELYFSSTRTGTKEIFVSTVL
jgi:hypothetical protein